MTGGFAPAEGALFADRYRVERLLGEGARKRVYLARDTRLGRPVALAVIKLKGLDADGFRRLRREVEATARLGDHPNVVTIHDSGEHEGEPFLVTQYLDGGTLGDLLDAAPGRKLPVGETVYLADQL
jgi:serine/threonine protein kinase